jgi:hypothetical protein
MNLKVKFSLPKFNKSLRLIYAGTVIFSLLAFAQFTFLLYKNFFSAIDQSKTIFIMRGMIATQKVDISSFGRVVENIESKKKSCLENPGRNPFMR